MIALCARAAEAIDGLAQPVVEYEEVSLDCPREILVATAQWLKENAPFELLADWSAIDWLGHELIERRFCLSAQLAAVGHPGRIRLRVWIPEADPQCPSLGGVWSAAQALEREMWDMFGVTFSGHPNLTRILMPDGWVGHPQRKDEPLGGINVSYEHGQSVSAPDDRVKRATSTTGYPGRTS